MPCQYYTPGEEAAIARDEHKKALDKVTAEADVMREYIIALHDGKNPELPEPVLKKIRKSQVDHRKMDLARLENTFTKSRDAARLDLVWKADPRKPLEPQLGFNPDDF